MRLWEAWKLSQAFRQAPSDIYGMPMDFLPSFLFNRAVSLFGRIVEADLHQAAQGHKNESLAEAAVQNRLALWLQQEQKFADPASA